MDKKGPFFGNVHTICLYCYNSRQILLFLLTLCLFFPISLLLLLLLSLFFSAKKTNLQITTDVDDLQLRYLQTLNSISAEKNSTIVFPVPIDIISKLMQNSYRDNNDQRTPELKPGGGGGGGGTTVDQPDK